MSKPVTILYLDDEPEQLRRFEKAIGPIVNNPIKTVTRARDLYDLLRQIEVPCIVLVDLVLPELRGGGYEVITELRANPALTDSKSPILAVTSTSPDEFMLERAREAGADVFIHKPVEFDDLVAAIGKPGWFKIELKQAET